MTIALAQMSAKISCEWFVIHSDIHVKLTFIRVKDTPNSLSVALQPREMCIWTHINSLKHIGGCIAGGASWNPFEVVLAIAGILTFDTMVFSLTIIRVLKTSRYERLHHVASIDPS